jgi:glycerol-3-phosphate acyltransferase PlsY
MIELILKGALSYLLGSIVASLAVARLTGGADIRTLGSGNAGATNALRTQGRKVALVVLVIDLAKGWIATAMVATWAVLGIKARLLLPMILTWLAAVIAFGYVGLASILGAVALAVALALTRSGTPLLVFGILSALLILYTHRSNLARMRAGTESRARRLWLFGTRRGHA